MKEVDPTWCVSVVVCANQRGPEATRRSCGREAGKALRYWLRDKARAEGMRSRIVVHAGGCMDVCGEGTTVAIHGAETRLWVVDAADREALWDEVVRSLP